MVVIEILADWSDLSEVAGGVMTVSAQCCDLLQQQFSGLIQLLRIGLS